MESMTSPSGGSTATIGETRCSTHKAMRSRDTASVLRSAGSTCRPGTSPCALLTGMPADKPSSCAIPQAAVTSRRLPTRSASTSGAADEGAASGADRLSRSIGHSGRVTEMTRAVACLQFEIETFPRPCPDQLNEPAGAADTGNSRGVEGSTDTRQRVIAAVGWPKS